MDFSDQHSRRLCTAATLALLLLSTVSSLHAECPVCIPSDAQFSVEGSELQTSLTAMGVSFQFADDPTGLGCIVYVTDSGDGNGPNATWVQAGNGMVQISDYGPDIQGNAFLQLSGAPAQTVTIIDNSHPITSGVSSSWSSFGFWHYDTGEGPDDYIGWVTDDDPNLAQIAGHDRGLSARDEGSGRSVYIGWNVYGSVATSEDDAILRNSIEWSGTCTIDELLSDGFESGTTVSWSSTVR